MTKKKSFTLHSAKIKITKLKNLLWECYCFLKDEYGTDDDDFLGGNEEFLSSSEDRGKELKLRIRKIFDKK